MSEAMAKFTYNCMARLVNNVTFATRYINLDKAMDLPCGLKMLSFNHHNYYMETDKINIY